MPPILTQASRGDRLAKPLRCPARSRSLTRMSSGPESVIHVDEPKFRNVSLCSEPTSWEVTDSMLV